MTFSIAARTVRLTTWRPGVMSCTAVRVVYAYRSASKAATWRGLGQLAMSISQSGCKGGPKIDPLRVL